MKAMPFPPEEFQGKGVLDFSSSYCSATDLYSLIQHQHQLVNNHSSHQPPSQEEKWRKEEEEEVNKGYVGCTEPTSVLDSRRSQSPPSSSCTMSSSLGSSNNSTSKGSAAGGACGGGGSASAAALASENPTPPPPEGSMEKCGGTRMVDDWEGQDQSILRLIMGDVEDPSAGLTKLLQTGSHNVDFGSGGFGVVEQGGLVMDPSVPGNYPAFPFLGAENMESHNAKTGGGVSEPIFASGNNPMMVSSSPAAAPGLFGFQQPLFGTVDEKPQVINPQFMMNHNQVQFSENPSFFVPLTYPQMQEQHVVYSQQPAKRPAVGHNYLGPRLPLLDSGQEQFTRRQQQAQLPLFPHHLQQHQQKVNSAGDEASNQLQQTLFDQLYKTAELIEAGNPVLAQGILARLNHQLSPIGKPFQRAALYMKEALQLLLHSNIPNFMPFSPISFIFKIGAYKSFSEISPVLQFANFTSNQVLIEALERFDRIHIIDFDIGFGVQWSSFMQELALRNSTASSLRVTAVVSPSTCDEVELNFTRENLSQYAKDINLSFELNILNIESLSSPSCSLAGQFLDNEAVAVNMPLSCFTHHPSLVPSVLHFVKQLRPKVVVTLDRNCDRIDVPLPTKVVHVLQYYSALLESLDAVNVNIDVLQKIEKHFIQPSIRNVITGHHHYHSQDKLPHWRNLFVQSGFSSFTFSNFTEAQAECLVQRAPVRGFQVERNHSSLVLCWQRKDLVSVSSWRC